MRGFVPTQSTTVDLMVELLFREKWPDETDRILDPGCGPGAFIDGILRWCEANNVKTPQITGVELDVERAEKARKKFAAIPQIEIITSDFLLDKVKGPFEYVIGNPPYVSILSLTEAEKRQFRNHYKCAVGRFDLYMLFIERAISLCKKDSTLVFITPEKFTYVQAGSEVRKLLASHAITDIILLQENEFPGRTTYPTISRVRISATTDNTVIRSRDGARFTTVLPNTGESWRHLLSSRKLSEVTGTLRLVDFCHRISCGIATGADAVFVKELNELPENLAQHAWPTISGRQLQPTTSTVKTSSVILIPYTIESRLQSLEDIGELGTYLSRSDIKSRLAMRSCTQRKPWHAFHDAPQMSDLLRPKILCKDICDDPVFWIDQEGLVVPRHSVYYIVPSNPRHLYLLAEFLNSDPAKSWLSSNAQRAANGFLRIQSSVLKRLPIPEHLAHNLLEDQITNLSLRRVQKSMRAEVLKVA
ncbi:Eco57I restriction-modification methylase domain-containing protein [Cyanobium sp. CH-040]|uniref:Eco57I restriction-modification methylase domain-containing protein n=1 Tax=Cyanobium sp. CH-040 TaxID=2823708 RepID=UPI0020CB71EC|nr:Eco57I restriction-modification methylase domain-containing protein [Cyanobium sp. CH-040]MCP9927838.1 Eco57I restriction-modification methylase domain-containing protein [Cyanobium sp. CH-040]